MTSACGRWRGKKADQAGLLSARAVGIVGRPITPTQGGVPMSKPAATTLYLIRHGATEANLATPPRLQGRKHNPPLARLGVRQAEATRDFLAIRPLDACYTSPLLRAAQTAAIVAAPHRLVPATMEALTE